MQPVDQVSTAGQQLLDRCSKLLQLTINMQAASTAGAVSGLAKYAQQGQPGSFASFRTPVSKHAPLLGQRSSPQNTPLLG